MEPYTRHLADQIKSALGDTTQGTLQKFDTLTSEWFQAQRSPGEQLKGFSGIRVESSPFQKSRANVETW